MRTKAIGITGLIVLLIGVVGATLLLNKPVAAPTTDAEKPGTIDTTAAPNNVKQGDVMELQKTDITTGTGKEAVSGTTVTVNYTGTLTNGTKFDSSLDRNQPFTFQLGAGQVIKGWDEGVVGMKVGGKRKLVIPPEMGYGNQATGSIPANSTLVFEVDLLDVK